MWPCDRASVKRKALDKTKPIDALIDKLEKLKAGVRAKVEHPFRLIKRQFGFVKVRYRGLRKNTAQLVTLFALFPPVDGAEQTDGVRGMSAPENRADARRRVKKVRGGGKNDGISGNWREIPPAKTSQLATPCRGEYSDHPYESDELQHLPTYSGTILALN